MLSRSWRQSATGARSALLCHCRSYSGPSTAAAESSSGGSYHAGERQHQQEAAEADAAYASEERTTSPASANLGSADRKGKMREQEPHMVDVSRFTRSRRGPSALPSLPNTAHGAAASTPQTLSTASANELLHLFSLACSRQTAHPVRDSWKAFQALPLDRRKDISAADRIAFFRIQVNRASRNAMEVWERLPIMIEMLEEAEVDIEKEDSEAILQKAVQWYSLRSKENEPVSEEETLQTQRMVRFALASWPAEATLLESIEALLRPLTTLLRLHRSPCDSTERGSSILLMVYRVLRQHLPAHFSPANDDHLSERQLDILSQLCSNLIGKLVQEGRQSMAMKLVLRLIRSGVVPAQDAMDRCLLAIAKEGPALELAGQRLASLESSLEPGQRKSWLRRQFPFAPLPKAASLTAIYNASGEQEDVKLFSNMIRTLEDYAEPSAQSESETSLARDKSPAMQRALLAAELYQRIVARGITPDWRLRRFLDDALRPLQGQPIPFPELREAVFSNLGAAVKGKNVVRSDSQLGETSNSVAPPNHPPAILSAFSHTDPEKFLRLAIDTHDWELARPLYEILRSRSGSFSWHFTEDVIRFRSFFSAAVKDAERPVSAGRTEEERRRAVAFAGDLYIHWREEGNKTPARLQSTVLRLIAVTPAIMRFRTLFNMLLSESYLSSSQTPATDTPVSSTQLLHFFQSLRRQCSYRDIWKPCHALLDLLAYQKYAFKVDVRIYNCVLWTFAAYLPEQRKEWSSRIWNVMLRNGVQPSLESYNAALAVRSKAGRSAERAVEVYENLLADSKEPNRATYEHLVRGYRRLDNQEKVFAYAMSAANQGWILEKQTASKVVRTLIKREMYAEAEQLLRAWRSLSSTEEGMGQMLVRLEALLQGQTGKRTEAMALASEAQALKPVHAYVAATASSKESVTDIRTIDLPQPDLGFRLAATASLPEQEQQLEPQTKREGESQPGFLSAFFTHNPPSDFASVGETFTSDMLFAPHTLSTFSSALAAAVPRPSISSASASITPALVAPASQLSSTFRSFSHAVAAMSLDQIAALRLSVEREAIAREERLQRSARANLSRADDSRWHGWSEHQAVPWYS